MVYSDLYNVYLDGFEFGDIIIGILLEHMASGVAKGAQPMQNGLAESCKNITFGRRQVLDKIQCDLGYPTTNYPEIYYLAAILQYIIY